MYVELYGIGVHVYEGIFLKGGNGISKLKSKINILVYCPSMFFKFLRDNKLRCAGVGKFLHRPLLR